MPASGHAADVATLYDPVRPLTARDYELLRRLVYERSGISLGPHKQALVRARLGKRLRAGGFRSFRDYYTFVQNDARGDELRALIDAITTNTTHLFREPAHFKFLRVAARPGCRVWSAGCSAGDEPYSIAMTLADTLGEQAGWRVLATDISTRMLERACAGVYAREALETAPAALRQRYVTPLPGAERTHMRIVRALRQHITFAYLNLMDEHYPFRHGFDFIFCRNVMIYFDRPTRARLINRLAGCLRPGGHLLIGHAESLNSVRHPLTYVQPTIYRKPPT